MIRHAKQSGVMLEQMIDDSVSNQKYIGIYYEIYITGTTPRP